MVSFVLFFSQEFESLIDRNLHMNIEEFQKKVIPDGWREPHEFLMGVSFEFKKLAHLVEHLKYDIGSFPEKLLRPIGVFLF